MTSTNRLLLQEAKALSDQGYIPIIQSRQLVKTPSGSYKKDFITGQRYKHDREQRYAFNDLRRYLYCNPNKGGTDSNILAILMHGFVNLDFDNMDEYTEFLQTGLIQHYSESDTKVNKTPNGLHYLYVVPDSWIGKFKKTTHIGGKHIDVLFGSHAIEYVYPSYVLHPERGMLTYDKVNNNLIQPMPDALRLYLEPFLNRYYPGETPSVDTSSRSIISDDPLNQRILRELVRFGYVAPAIVRANLNIEGFNFTYDHSVPDPLNPSVTHDKVDGFIIINRDDNVVIVGSYSSLCNSKILCSVTEHNFNEISFNSAGCDIPSIQYNSQYVQPFLDDHENGDSIKVSLIRSDMGTGKSHQVRRHITLHDPPSVLILTPRILFARSIIAKLNEGRSIPFLLYTDLREKSITCPFLICQMESIWKIARSYDFIYVDEIESCLATFSSETMSKFGKLTDCVQQFQSLLLSARRIIFCDAHISTRTTDVLSNLGFRKEQMLVEVNIFQPNKREAIEVPYMPSTGDQLIQVAISQLRQGKNIVFACSSKAYIEEKLRPAVTAVLQPSDYIFYTGDSPESDNYARVACFVSFFSYCHHYHRTSPLPDLTTQIHIYADTVIVLLSGLVYQTNPF